MKLRKYIMMKGLTAKGFAQKIGVSVSHFSRVINSRENAGVRLAKKIEDETDGMIDIMSVMTKEALDDTPAITLEEAFRDD